MLALLLLAPLAACVPAGNTPAPTAFGLRALNAVSGLAGVEVRRGIPYGPGERQRLDLYLPAAAASRPVVVFGYGGGFLSGDRGLYAFAGEAFASLGYPTVVYDYRLHPEVSFPATLEDPALAAAWASRNAPGFGGDPDRLILAGHSAGAYAAAMLAADPRYLRAAGLDPRKVAAVVGLSGGYDFGPPYPTEDIARVMAGAGRESQPISFVDGSEPPFVIAHSRGDTLLAVEGARAMTRALRERGVRVVYLEYGGSDHSSPVAYLSRALRGSSSLYRDLRDALDHLGLTPGG